MPSLIVFNTKEHKSQHAIPDSIKLLAMQGLLPPNTQPLGPATSPKTAPSVGPMPRFNITTARVSRREPSASSNTTLARSSSDSLGSNGIYGLSPKTTRAGNPIWVCGTAIPLEWKPFGAYKDNGVSVLRGLMLKRHMTISAISSWPTTTRGTSRLMPYP